MEQVLTHPGITRVARRLLQANKKARDNRLSNTELMVLSQHQTAQEFHTDGGSWYRVQAMEKQLGEEILVSANIALTEFTATNGATRVVPGSHLWAADRQPAESEIGYAVMPKGAALFYSGNVIHSGGANTDAMLRIGLYLGYIVSWLRPIENQMVTNEPRDILALGDAARQLLDVVDGGFTVIA
jgi:ectoine hydroxylase-related dioxygenase (phytanoyl-CoA dioxygenase family)